MVTKVKPYDIDPMGALNKQVLAFNSLTGEFEAQDQIGGGGSSVGSNVIWISPPQNHIIGNVATFIHNANFSQADIESGRYELKFVYRVASTPAFGIDSGGNDILSGVTKVVKHKWDASDPTDDATVCHQGNSFKVLSSTRGDNIQMLRCIIIDNNIVGGEILPPRTTTYFTNFIVEDSLGAAIPDAVIRFNGFTNNVGNYNFETNLGTFEYEVSRPGYGTEIGEVLVDGITPHTIVLTSTGATLHDIVFDITSDTLGPLSDAVVTLGGVTYPVGQVVFSVPDDTYSYTINRLGHTAASGSIVVSGSDVIEVVSMVALPPLYNMNFIVEDTFGNAISDARVTIGGNTYPAGTYNFITNAGTYSYVVHRRGYESVSGSVTLSSNVDIDIIMSQTPNTQLHNALFNIEDNLGNPISNAKITLNSIVFPAGQYSFNIPTGIYSYVVSKNGYISNGGHIVVSGPTSETVVLEENTVSPFHSVTFNVSSGGTPITDAIIVFNGVTYPAGQYVFSGLSNGTYSYQIHKQSYMPVLSGSVSVSGADVVTGVSLSFNPAAYTLLFSVSDGVNPITDATITFNGTTYSPGVNVFSLFDGTYSYAVQKIGHEAVFGSVTISGSNATETVILTPNPSLLTYTFQTAVYGGGMIFDAYVRLNGVLFPQGNYVFSLPSGIYNREVLKTGYGTETGTKNLLANSIEAVVLTPVGTTYTVTFNVEDTLGSPISDAVVTFNGVTNAAGNYVFTGVSAGGPYNRDVVRSGYVTATGTQSVSGNTTVNVQLSVVSGMINVGNVSIGDEPHHIAIDGGFAYVTCYSSHRVDKINLSTFTNVGNVSVGDYPYGIAIDGGFAYVACSGSDRVDKIDLGTFTVVGNVSIGDEPRGIAISGGFAYVTCFGSHRVDKINLSTFTNVGNVSVGTGPIGIAIDGGFAYVTCLISDRVDKINLSTFNNVGNISVGSYPERIAIDGGFAYVTCSNSNRVDKIKLSTFTNVGNVSVGNTPLGIAISGGFAYVACYTPNRVDKINLSTFTNVGSVSVGYNPHHIAISGGFAYVTCSGSDRVDKISLGTITNVGNISVGDAPHGITIDGGFAYVTCEHSNRVDKIDLSTFTNVGNVAVGQNPHGIAIDGGFAYVACQYPNRVDKIDLSTFTVVGNVGVGSEPYGIAISGGFAYVTCNVSNRVDKIDLSTFTNVGNVSVGSEPRGIAIDGGFAYVVFGGINRIDKIDLSTFTVVGALAIGSSLRGITIDGGFACVTCPQNHRVYKIDLSIFTYAGNVGTGYQPHCIAIDGGFAYVTCFYEDRVDKIYLG